jgi:hypothetical protein
LPIDFADAKPFWSALYHSLTFANAERYEYRRSSIFRISTGCDDLTMRDKRLNLLDLVAREGVEPPTPAFSGLRSLGPNRVSNQQLNSSRRLIYCDHSVTSADVRLTVGVECSGLSPNKACENADSAVTTNHLLVTNKNTQRGWLHEACLEQ